MKDSIIIRMAEESGKALSDMDPHIEAPRLTVCYNAMLQAAKTNHPEDSFLSTLTIIKADDCEDVRSGELRVLLALLRVALESLKSEASPSGEH